MREDDLKDFSSFLKEFQSETDRGAALVGAALIDQKLSDILEAFMVNNKIADELLNGANAPLGALSARTKAAYAFGLIDDHELGECDLIRKIRNEFAHSIHGTTFFDQKIHSLCKNLKSDLPGERKDFSDKPREMFINAVILIVLRLTYRSERVSKERRITKTWPY